MKPGHIEIFVKAPLESQKFYTDILGFKVEAVQHEKFVWLSSGELTILLRPGENRLNAESYQSANSAIVLYTDELEAAKSQLEAKGLVFKGTDGSPECLTFTDLDGNWFQLVNPNHA
jgi:catechol 2,3-dioxygenase-like lactoylglutathione lyase family enzyme